jgi:vancomycin permeability regulator SanA
MASKLFRKAILTTSRTKIDTHSCARHFAACRSSTTSGPFKVRVQTIRGVKNMNRSQISQILVMIAAAFLIASIFLVFRGMSDEIAKADVAVVLGNTVNPDGSPSYRLAARLDAAVALYHQGMFNNVIVSGGVGREGFDEAAVMKDYLTRRGVPSEKIVVDSFGITTAATARNVAAIAKAHRWSSVLVVSQYFHIPRCRLALSVAGFDHVYAAHARYFEIRDVYSIIREVIGYAAYLWIAKAGLQ